MTRCSCCYSRFAYINRTGTCIVGMERIAMIPLLSFEILVNVSITYIYSHYAF